MKRDWPVRDSGPRERRALVHVGGQVSFEGDRAFEDALTWALTVSSSIEAEDAARAHVHGFHSYPARMHPVTAGRLVQGLSREGDLVLDPFAGSGTVLVEARLCGREAWGVDANPLAVRLARLKAGGVGPRDREKLVAGAMAAAELADTRRKAKSGPTKRYGPEDLALFDTHVLLELDGLRAGIDALESQALKQDLELVLSAILTKVSRKTSDSAGYDTPKRIAAGYPSRLLVKKAEELVQRMAEVADDLLSAPPLRVLEGDARELPGIPNNTVNLVVTSPPYPGVYDYLSHHEARLRWLRLKTKAFDEAEIGARRHVGKGTPEAGIAKFRDDMKRVSLRLEKALKKGGIAVLLVADGVVAGAPLYADELFRAIAAGTGLAVKAVASQERPHFHGPTERVFRRKPRREHAVVLGR